MEEEGIMNLRKINSKSMNKRGQDLPIGTLILIVLGVIVLVLLVVGFTKGWDYILNFFAVAPGKSLETAVQSCNLAGQGGLRTDYCLDFKKVDYAGETQYVNCEDDVIKTQLTTPLDSTCGDSVTEAVKTFCYNKISASDFSKVKVHGKTCFEQFGQYCREFTGACNGKVKKNAEGKECCFNTATQS